MEKLFDKMVKESYYTLVIEELQVVNTEKKSKNFCCVYEKIPGNQLKTKQDIPREISMIYNLLWLCKVLSIPYKYLLSVNS